MKIIYQVVGFLLSVCALIKSIEGEPFIDFLSAALLCAIICNQEK